MRRNKKFGSFFYESKDFLTTLSHHFLYSCFRHLTHLLLLVLTLHIVTVLINQFDQLIILLRDILRRLIPRADEFEDLLHLLLQVHIN